MKSRLSLIGTDCCMTISFQLYRKTFMFFYHFCIFPENPRTTMNSSNNMDGLVHWSEMVWSKYPNHKSEFFSHLDIDSSEILDTQTWTPKKRYNQVLEKSKYNTPPIAMYLWSKSVKMKIWYLEALLCLN